MSIMHKTCMSSIDSSRLDRACSTPAPVARSDVLPSASAPEVTLGQLLVVVGHRYKFDAISWHELSRRADFPLLLAHPVARHLDLNDDGSFDTNVYMRDLKSRLEGATGPSAYDFLDYVALLAAHQDEVATSDEAAEDAIASAVAAIARGEHSGHRRCGRWRRC